MSSKQLTEGASPNPTLYSYNLSGALIEQTYPSGRVIRNTLDADGDLMQVQSRKANDTLRNYANGFTYTAAGAVSAMRLGNGKWESVAFNTRFQPTRIGLGGSASDQSLLRLDYTYGVVESGLLNTAKNNGNIQSQTITVPTVGSSTGFTAVQIYTYDSLNRIDDATEKIGSTETWKQDYTFDRYGNRNFVEANTTTIPKNCTSGTVCPADRKVFNPSIAASTNRINLDQDGDNLNDYAFDSSGNTTRDPQMRKFTYDAENKQTKVEAVNSSGTVTGTIGEYFYDGDGRRVKKIAYTNNQVTETTVFLYDASSRLVAEYSTDLNPTPQVAYLTNDHLGSPRVNTNENGAVISRHDYLPFGEEINSGTGGRTTAQGYGGQDSIRQKFTGYERDAEIDLDFAQARMYNKNHGRFTTTDPIYFQREMIVDPQRFNLYIYTRNNPLKWLDPSGEKVRIAQGSSMDELYQSVGGQENFDKYFEVKDGLVTLRDGVDISKANQGVQFLNELVGRNDTFLVYLGADADAVAKMFAGTTNDDGTLNKAGQAIAKKFRDKNYIVSTSGRPLSEEQPGGGVFTVLAINPAAFNYTQIGVGNSGVETETLQTGVSQRVRPVSLLLHELAENLDFSINGTGAGNPAPDKKLQKKKATRALYDQQMELHRGFVDYRRAHNSAIRREIQIRRDLTTINGGFAGGELQRQQ